MTPKGTRPGARGGRPQIDPETRRWLEAMESSAADLVSCGPDIDEADCWASAAQEFVAFPDAPIGPHPAQILAHARDVGGPVGAAITAAVAAYGPERSQAPARRQLDKLAASDDVPSWATMLGRVTPEAAFLRQDELSEDCAVTIHYRRPDRSLHGLEIDIGWFASGAALGFDLLPERECLDLADRGSDQVQRLSLADARALSRRALDRFTSMNAFNLCFDLGHDLKFARMDLGFLAEQRLDLLPEGGSDAALFVDGSPDRHPALIEFEQADRPAVEGDAEFEAFVEAIDLFGMLCRDCDVAKWTPLRVEAFVQDFVPVHSPTDLPECSECGDLHPDEFDADFMSTVESAFRRWLRFAAEHSEPSKELLDENLHAAAESFGYWRAGASEQRTDRLGVPDLWLPRAS